jgi:hypothetical protein
MHMARVHFAAPAPYILNRLEIEDAMKTLWLMAAVPLLALAPPARAGDPAPAVAPSGAVGCLSPGSILHYSDAVDNGDRRIVQRLLNGQCRALDGAAYQLLDEHNGMTKILVFKRPGDWESAEVLYTLAEMLELE